MGRAYPCLSLHLVSPLRKFAQRKLRKSRGSITSFLGGTWHSAWRRRACTFSCKVRPESGAFFIIYFNYCFVRLAPPAPFEGGAQILLVGPVHTHEQVSKNGKLLEEGKRRRS